MKRREFITLIGAGAAVWPARLFAQTGRTPRVGWIWAGHSAGDPSSVAGFKQGLLELKYTEGSDIIVDYRFAEGAPERLPTLASELAGLHPEVVFAFGNGAIQATRRVLPRTPTVFISGDPIGTGVVTNLSKPGGNLTGLSLMVLSEKWPDIARDLLPGIRRAGFLWNPTDPRSAASFNQARRPAEALGLNFASYPVERFGDLESIFASVARDGVGMLMVDASHPSPTNWPLVAQLGLRYKMPCIADDRDFVRDGGLVSYGASIFDISRRAAHYVHKILGGEKPGEIPVEQPTKFDLVINLKTAKALGLTIPPTLLARADEVIE